MRKTIAVSGINAIDNPGPGTGIAKSLSESGLDCRIVGLAYDAMEPGIYMDWIIDKSYIMPYPSGDLESYINRIRDIHERERLDVVIPSLDVELPVFIKIRQELAGMGIGMMIPSYASFRARDKDKLPELADTIGLAVPRTIVMTSVTECDAAARELGFPLMIKGPFYDAVKVSGHEEMKKEFHALSARWGFPVIAQVFITGDEYNCVGLGYDGRDIGHVAVKKVLITKLGKIWTNVSIVNGRIFDAAVKMVESLAWSGGYELELIYEPHTDTMYLIEINPRFPAWVYMATGCGINLPHRMVQAICGMQYDTHSDYQAGSMMIRYTGELIRTISDFETLATSGESA